MPRVLSRGPESISPTAHYTGVVWARHGLSHPALATAEGRLLYAALTPAMLASTLAGGPSLEALLLARHRVIDHLLEAAIDARDATQVLELAAGLSPRGWRMTERHGDAITYVEADLPAMAARKRRALDVLGGGPRVVDLDVLAPGGLEALADAFDPERGLAVITEGLLNYLDADAVDRLWGRIAAVLGRFPHGLYLSDLVLRGAGGATGRAFSALLSAFVRGHVHFHFYDEAAVIPALLRDGFDTADVHSPAEFPQLPGTLDRGAGLVRVVEARRH